MNENYTIKISDEKEECCIQFHLNNEELQEFLKSSTFKALIDDLLKVTFEK